MITSCLLIAIAISSTDTSSKQVIIKADNVITCFGAEEMAAFPGKSANTQKYRR